jgi:hypothetical protein
MMLASGNIAYGTVGLAFLVIIALTVLTLWWATRAHQKALA